LNAGDEDNRAGRVDADLLDQRLEPAGCALGVVEDHVVGPGEEGDQVGLVDGHGAGRLARDGVDLIARPSLVVAVDGRPHVDRADLVHWRRRGCVGHCEVSLQEIAPGHTGDGAEAVREVSAVAVAIGAVHAVCGGRAERHVPERGRPGIDDVGKNVSVGNRSMVGGEPIQRPGARPPGSRIRRVLAETEVAVRDHPVELTTTLMGRLVWPDDGASARRVDVDGVRGSVHVTEREIPLVGSRQPVVAGIGVTAAQPPQQRVRVVSAVGEGVDVVEPEAPDTHP